MKTIYRFFQSQIPRKPFSAGLGDDAELPATSRPRRRGVFGGLAGVDQSLSSSSSSSSLGSLLLPLRAMTPGEGGVYKAFRRCWLPMASIGRLCCRISVISCWCPRGGSTLCFLSLVRSDTKSYMLEFSIVSPFDPYFIFV